MIEWIDKLFCSKCTFENALVVKEWELNCLMKHGLVEGIVVLIYNWFTYIWFVFS